MATAIEVSESLKVIDEEKKNNLDECESMRGTTKENAVRCGSPASYTVLLESELTDDTYELNVCPSCYQRYRENNE